jgi:O-antigen ligase
VPDGDPRFGQVGLALFASAIIAVALVFSLSRGGILASVVSLGVMFLVLRRRFASPLLLRAAAVGVPLLVLALVLWIGAGVVAERWGQIQAPGEASLRSRLVVWRTILESVGPFLRTGAGLGAFDVSFAPFTPAGSATRWDQAHNDYLQLLWETGLPGTLLAAWLVGVFVARYGWPAMRERRHSLNVLRTGVATALLAVAVHSLVDFNLQIGANGFLCAVLAGVLVALTRLVDAAPEKERLHREPHRGVLASSAVGDRGVHE